MAGGKGKRLKAVYIKLSKANDKNRWETYARNNNRKMHKKWISKFLYFCKLLKRTNNKSFRKQGKMGDQNKLYYEDFPLGTAGSLKLIPDKISESVLVLNGDVITNLDLSLFSRFHQKHNAYMTIAAKNEQFKIPYGVITTSGLELENIAEKPTYNFLVSAGIYIIKTSILKYIEKNKFCDMPDLVSIVKEKNLQVVTF